MTIASNQFFTDWLGADGANKDWSYSFPIRAQSDIYIQLKSPTGVITETQTDIGWFPTNKDEGYVRYPSAAGPLVTGWFVRIVRRLAYTQPTEIGNEGSFRPEIHEEAFDRATQQIQQVADEAGRALKGPFGVKGPTLERIPAGNFYTVDEDGNFVDAGPTPAAFGGFDQIVAMVAFIQETTEPWNMDLIEAYEIGWGSVTTLPVGGESQFIDAYNAELTA